MLKDINNTQTTRGFLINEPLIKLHSAGAAGMVAR